MGVEPTAGRSGNGSSSAELRGSKWARADSYEVQIVRAERTKSAEPEDFDRADGGRRSRSERSRQSASPSRAERAMEAPRVEPHSREAPRLLRSRRPSDRPRHPEECFGAESNRHLPGFNRALDHRAAKASWKPSSIVIELGKVRSLSVRVHRSEGGLRTPNLCGQSAALSPVELHPMTSEGIEPSFSGVRARCCAWLASTS